MRFEGPLTAASSIGPESTPTITTTDRKRAKEALARVASAEQRNIFDAIRQILINERITDARDVKRITEDLLRKLPVIEAELIQTESEQAEVLAELAAEEHRLRESEAKQIAAQRNENQLSPDGKVHEKESTAEGAPWQRTTIDANGQHEMDFDDPNRAV